MNTQSFLFSYILALLLLVSSCSKPDDISGRLDGIWTTQWEDILKGDVDDIKVEEGIEFVSSNYLGNAGSFRQIFEGDVKFDDWENESWVSYNVFISGTWMVKDNDVIELKYDLNEMVVTVGKSNVEADYTEAGISLLFGNWSGALSSALKASDTSKINQRIEKEVFNQLNSFFKEMFHDINKDKKGMTKVVIDGNMMTCDVNHGFFGREQVYDRVKVSTKNSEVAETAADVYNGEYNNYDSSEGQQKVIIDLNGKVVGNYVGETETTYIGEGQDDFEVPKSNHRIITLDADKGEGVIYCKEPGDEVKVYPEPLYSDQIIGKMVYKEGYVPETYECLGKDGNWYKIRFNHRIGYVNVKDVEWAAEDFF